MVFYAIVAGKFWSLFSFMFENTNVPENGGLLATMALIILPLFYILRMIRNKQTDSRKPDCKGHTVEMPQSLSDWFTRKLLCNILEPIKLNVGEVHGRIISTENKWTFAVFMAKLESK